MCSHTSSENRKSYRGRLLVFLPLLSQPQRALSRRSPPLKGTINLSISSGIYYRMRSIYQQAPKCITECDQSIRETPLEKPGTADFY